MKEVWVKDFGFIDPTSAWINFKRNCISQRLDIDDVLYETYNGKIIEKVNNKCLIRFNEHENYIQFFLEWA